MTYFGLFCIYRKFENFFHSVELNMKEYIKYPKYIVSFFFFLILNTYLKRFDI